MTPRRSLIVLLAVMLGAGAAAGVSPSLEVPDLFSPEPEPPERPPFEGLGTWVDLWDTGVSPERAVPRMAERGVRTIYLQTARYNSSKPLPERPWVDRWLSAAHAHGLQVVGWYLPAYGPFLDRDVKRTKRIDGYVSGDGHRFDALAIDIEHKGATDTRRAFNRGIVEHLRRVRDLVGPDALLGAIIPAPIAMQRSPSSWTGFPFADIGRYADVVLPMAYWSYRLADGSCSSDARYCAAAYGRDNAKRATNKTGLPVHIIGGIGHRVSHTQVRRFVEGAAPLVIGGSMYDWRTTKSHHWKHLERFDG